MDKDPTHEIFGNTKINNSRLIALYNEVESVFEDDTCKWKNHITWWFPSLQNAHPALKTLVKLMKIPAATRPVAYILVSDPFRNFEHLTARLTWFMTYRSNLRLFNTGTIEKPVEFKHPSKYRYVVLCTLDHMELKERRAKSSSCINGKVVCSF